MSYTIGGTRTIWNYTGATVSTANITAIANYQNITDIVLPNTATKVGSSAFINNFLPLLKSVSMPFVTNIEGNAFVGCSALTTVYMPQCIFIGWAAFDNCLKLTNIHLKCDSGAVYSNPNDFLGSSSNNIFFISTDNATTMKLRLNSLGTTNTTNFKADRVFVEYKTTAATGTTGAITFLHNSVSTAQYDEFMKLYTETAPGTGIPVAGGFHKTVYDNIITVQNNGLLTAYNNFSQLDANYSSLTVDLAPHYWKFISAISSTGYQSQPNTTELVITFTAGTFNKKLVYKLNK